MAKRTALAFDRDGLAKDLKASAGRGMDAFFGPTSREDADTAPSLSSSSDAKGVTTPDQQPSEASGVPARSDPAASPTASSEIAISPAHGGSPIAEAPRIESATHGTDREVRPAGQKGGVVASHHDTTTPRHHSTASADEVRRLRKVVKEFGKEAATYRFTREEKEQLSDIIHTCRRQGYRTSEVEIARIAVNWLLGDYRERGKRSLLYSVVRALRE